MTYSDERICTFATQADGSLILTSDFPFGVVKIQRALVGDIVFAYEGEASEETTGSTEQEGGSAETAEGTHSWYICFAPADAPEIAIVVLMEHAGTGSRFAVPAAKKLLDLYFQY
jgi:hypothetical protein